jgi:sRNA-binding protein
MSSNPSLVPAPADPAPFDCAEQLGQRFPALFGGGFKPLKLRIQDDIQQRAPGVFARQALSAFLRRYTGSTGYLVAVTKASHRLDLDGQPSGEVSAEHR